MTKLQDRWTLNPAHEPRIEGLLALSWAISDIHDAVTGQLDGPDDECRIWPPLQLAARMREAAERIEGTTEEPSQAARTASSANGHKR